MAVGDFPLMGGNNSSRLRTLRDVACISGKHFHPFSIAPAMALFLAINLHRSLQRMDSHARAPKEDEVVYYVNRDSAGWVEQRVRRRVYIELKLECTRNRSRDNQKARDDWLCVYCKSAFPSKLRLTDHRVVGCPCGLVDESGLKLALPVYPNLKTAKQGKDLKLALQCGDGAVWQSLHDNSVWLELNPELRDVTYPPYGARVHKRSFWEPTVENLIASPATPGDVRPQGVPKPQRPPRQHSAPAAADDPVVIEDDDSDEPDTPPTRPKKRPHTHMAKGQRVFHSSRQFKATPRRHTPTCQAQPGGGEHHSPGSSRNARYRSAEGVHRQSPVHPIRVAPIQTRSPSPERAVILRPPPPSPPPMPNVRPVSPMQSSPRSPDLASGLRKDRQSFYVKVASAAQASVKTDIPKPSLRPPIQPPGLFHLMACGLLNFDLDGGEFQAFQAEVEKWQKEPSFMVQLFAAFGRFHLPTHQVQPKPHPLT